MVRHVCVFVLYVYECNSICDCKGEISCMLNCVHLCVHLCVCICQWVFFILVPSLLLLYLFLFLVFTFLVHFFSSLLSYTSPLSDATAQWFKEPNYYSYYFNLSITVFLHCRIKLGLPLFLSLFLLLLWQLLLCFQHFQVSFYWINRCTSLFSRACAALSLGVVAMAFMVLF